MRTNLRELLSRCFWTLLTGVRGDQWCASTCSVNIIVGALSDMELKSACRMFLFPVQMFYYIIRASLFSLLPSRRKDLSKEVVLITGGGRGIGRHLAKEFAKQGARKVISFDSRQLLLHHLYYFNTFQRNVVSVDWSFSTGHVSAAALLLPLSSFR